MKTLFLTCLISIFTNTYQTNDKTTVFISTGNKAYAYHSRKTCRTLKKCVEEGHVKEITLEEALNKGRRPCKVCCKTK